MVNDDIDRLRHSATRAVLERRDVIVVASVSCIYGIGSPQDYMAMHLVIEEGMHAKRDGLLRRIVATRPCASRRWPTSSATAARTGRR